MTLVFSRARRPAPDVCIGKILTLVRHLNATGKLLELDQSLEQNPVHICLTKLFFTILCMLSLWVSRDFLINISEWEQSGNVMNYLHTEPENTASKSTQTQDCYATIFSRNQAFWLGTQFWTFVNGLLLQTCCCWLSHVSQQLVITLGRGCGGK